MISEGHFPCRRPLQRTRLVPAGVICTVILALCINNAALAQLSPGPLSHPHSHLSGLKKCSSCHKLGSRQVGDKCLDCHTEIAAMRQGGPGMHAAGDFNNCVDCHVEHQGEDYELISWPDGPSGFDHRTIGFEKTGKHAELDCRKCHFAKYIVDAGSLKAKNKDLGRTYLGLDSACTSCHADVHGKTKAAARVCTDCHDTNGWRPAPLFVHGKTAFPLDGKHQAVDCAKCHVPAGGASGEAAGNSAGKPSRLVFSSLSHGACTDCHLDPHAGTLGADCRQCHSTAGWLLIQGASFDHTKTRYPLQGRHVTVTCAGCHAQERKKPKFGACNDCHGDAHGGTVASRPRLTQCEDCHTVEGFRPARFPLARHAETAYPLTGAHQATPCDACHRPLGTGPHPRAADLTIEFASCTACHQDPHKGQTEKYTTDRGCVSCHTEESWRSVTFDHGKTGFALDGRHAAADCLACHQRSGTELPFSGAARHCAGCHKDVHKDQFADKTTADGQAVACDRCHVTVDWLAEKFDHDRDSRFTLKGGHEKVACTGCHRPLESGNDRLLHFKPLPTSCKDCHTNDPGPEGKSS